MSDTLSDTLGGTGRDPATDPATEGWYSEARATFGDRLAAAREAAGLSQKSLAKRLGVKAKTVTAWENDLAEPRANRLQMLAGLLNVSLMWLLNGEGEGLDGPAGEAAGPGPEMRSLLLELRQIRTEMDAAADRLARVEKRLRTALDEVAEA